MSVVDNILKRWAKDITQLKAAAQSERGKIQVNNRQIDSLIAANHSATSEADRADQIVANLQALLATPTDTTVAP